MDELDDWASYLPVDDTSGAEWDDWAGDFVGGGTSGGGASGGEWSEFFGDYISNLDEKDRAFAEDLNDVLAGNYTVEDLYIASQEDPSILSQIGGILSDFGSSALKGLANTFTKDGKPDWKTIATVGGGILGLMGVGKTEQRPTGYQGKIPDYTAVRERVDIPYDPERRPGSGGQKYFSDVIYAAPGEVEAAQTAAAEQATGLASIAAANPAMQKRPPTRVAVPQETATQTETRPASAVIEDIPVPTYATGGVAGLKKGRYLRGETDGMKDELRTTIENKQPAALSHGEFVIPADVVSHLGNGNSEAGAKKLYEMMEKIRLARTGNPKQGKQINPNKYLPA